MRKQAIGLLITVHVALNLVGMSASNGAEILSTEAGRCGGYVLNEFQYLAIAVPIESATSLSGAMVWLDHIVTPGRATLALYSDIERRPGRLLARDDFFVDDRPGWYGLSALDWPVDAGQYWVAFEAHDSDLLATVSGKRGKSVLKSWFSSKTGEWSPAVAHTCFGVKVATAR